MLGWMFCKQKYQDRNVAHLIDWRRHSNFPFHPATKFPNRSDCDDAVLLALLWAICFLLLFILVIMGGWRIITTTICLLLNPGGVESHIRIDSGFVRSTRVAVVSTVACDAIKIESPLRKCHLWVLLWQGSPQSPRYKCPLFSIPPAQMIPLVSKPQILLPHISLVTKGTRTSFKYWSDGPTPHGSTPTVCSQNVTMAQIVNRRQTNRLNESIELNRWTPSKNIYITKLYDLDLKQYWFC